jgi:hypothetical protein
MATPQIRSKRKSSGKPPGASTRKTLSAKTKSGATGGKLLVSFRDKDGLLGVTRGTMRRLAAELNLKETQVVHVALRRLADSVLPAYEPDDGPLSAEQLATIRRLAGRQEIRSVSTTLL